MSRFSEMCHSDHDDHNTQIRSVKHLEKLNIYLKINYCRMDFSITQCTEFSFPFLLHEIIEECKYHRKGHKYRTNEQNQ